MKIILRGEKVRTQLISKSLSSTEKDYYKPVWAVSLWSMILTLESFSGDIHVVIIDIIKVFLDGGLITLIDL